MSYANDLGEFIVNKESENWPKEIRYIERRPVTGRFVMNPWETERQRIVWQEEEKAWKKIVVLKDSYTKKEKRMKDLAAMWNRHLQEVESVAGKKTGLGPFGTYGGMALTVIPGFGWAAAALTAFSMIFEMIGGNKKKKRIAQLLNEMEGFAAEMRKLQAQLQAIVIELESLIGTTQKIQAGQAAHAAQVAVKQGFLIEQRRQAEQIVSQHRQDEISRYRQAAKNTLPLHPISDSI